MKKYLIIFVLLISWKNLDAKECLIIKDFESNKIIKQEGELCEEKFSPASTFKLPIALMGFDSGILIDEQNPEWKRDKKYPMHEFILNDGEPKNPTSWIKNSTVWYSQMITEKLGGEKFADYIKKFGYGNQDISGSNALSHSWLCDTLKISPTEQLDFLEKFLNKKLPVSDNAYKMTHNIAFFQDLNSGEKLFGKSGSCKTHGWFVGWTEKDNKPNKIFVKIIDEKEMVGGSYAGPRARNLVIEELSK